MSRKPPSPAAVTHPQPSGADDYAFRRRRTKAEWAGVGVGDAFKRNLDYFTRMPAQRLFYDLCKRMQVAAARLAGATVEPGFQVSVKPQLTPCYTSYPAHLAAYAAVGLTAFLEFQSRISPRLLRRHLRDYLKSPAGADQVAADPKLYRRTAEAVASSVQTRLLLEELSRASGMDLVEIYRLFSASQQALDFPSLPAIINAIILYGDLLPDWRPRPLHPLTRALLGDLTDTCQPYFARLAAAKSTDLLALGADWVKAACRSLAPYLPPPKGQEGEEQGDDPHRAPPPEPDDGARPRFGHPNSPPPDTNQIAPLDGPNPPALFDSADPAHRAAQDLLEELAGTPPESTGTSEEGEPSQADRLRAALSDFGTAAEQAGGQPSDWEDMRSDRVERVLRPIGFGMTPIQGTPTDGHDVRVRLGEEMAGGELFDRAVELSDNLPAYDKLVAESRPVTDALRRTLYPNIEQEPETERFRTSGSLDPARLVMADFSDVVFKRYRVHERVDRRGQPVLLIACDGSGSLDHAQMRMLKVLAAAWLNSTTRTRVQLLAALYHSGTIRHGVTGPLVQWLYHPQKTPAISRKQAARALVALPNTGTGAQSDALSLAFLLEEAQRLARGRMVYLILITDCEWNRSFETEKSGEEEMRCLFDEVYADADGKLHTTLVAVGVDGETGFESRVEKVITVPETQLGDPVAVAERIGVYVASCIKERQRLIARR